MRDTLKHCRLPACDWSSAQRGGRWADCPRTNTCPCTSDTEPLPGLCHTACCGELPPSNWLELLSEPDSIPNGCKTPQGILRSSQSPYDCKSRFVREKYPHHIGGDVTAWITFELFTGIYSMLITPFKILFLIQFKLKERFKDKFFSNGILPRSRRYLLLKCKIPLWLIPELTCNNYRFN